jgi:hypothetical protein
MIADQTECEVRNHISKLVYAPSPRQSVPVIPAASASALAKPNRLQKGTLR